MPVSAVVINHNGKGFLDACLEALFREGPDEVILVDSGSTDGSAGEALGKHDLRLLDLGGNLGPSVARNRGMRAARHDRVLLLDNDVVLEPGCLGRLQAHLDGHPEICLVQARSLLSPGGAEALVHYDGASFHFLGFLGLRNWFRPLEEAEGEGLVEVDCAISLCLLGDRRELEAAGAFDEVMFYLMEDAALCYALRLSGRRIAVAEDALCLHLGGTRGLSIRREEKKLPSRRSYLQSRNRWIFVLIHYRWRSLLLLAPAFLLYGLAHLSFVLVSGQLGPWFRGKRDLLPLLPHLRGRRRRIQALRRTGDRELLGCPPFTFHPGLVEGGLRRTAERGLHLATRLWFLAVRWAL